MPSKRTSKALQADKKLSKVARDAKKNADLPKKAKADKEVKKGDNNSDKSEMTLCTYPTIGVRPQVVTRERRPGRPPSGKRLALSREMPAKVRSAFRRSLDPCDNSNDSGLGFDHHADSQHMGMSDRITWTADRAEAKRPRMDIKIEQDERYNFPETLKSCKDSTSLIRTAPSSSIPSLNITNSQATSSGHAVPRCIPLSNRQTSSSPVSLTTQLTHVSRYMDICLTILKQPEQQHRARYQTEGSRGAVKDREGNGFPIVQLTGYYQPTTLQVFIGTDVGKVTPHMFYQACKVSGKNSTPCVEKKIDGTCVIELQLDPSKEMSATCDCVGILKERNVDVEHRFPDQLGNRSKKKSTRCRMIFRTTVTLDDGTTETLQVCSQPIVCTQPPGVPEICKKSLTSCPASGGLELFVLGKNFLKDTKVYFQQVDDDRHVRWEQAVVPDKEYLQQTHFVCVIPPYRRPDINEPVTVRLCVVSSGKTSEPHQFVYTPVNGAIPSVHGDSPPQTTSAPFFNKLIWPSVSKREQDLGMMPPPESSMVPMATRRPSLSIASTSEVHSPPLRTLKQEYIDENSQNSIIDPVDIHQERFRHISESSLDVNHGDSNLSMMNENSMDVLNSRNSILNENSNENSVDNVQQVHHSTIVGENSNSGILHCNNSSVVTDRLVLSQPIIQNILASSAAVTQPTAQELKVMDLRMKMPMATVADLVNSTAPSMATLHSFGVTDASNGPLPAQSAQSVENFLTNIEAKLVNQLLPSKDNVVSVSDKINEIIRNESTFPKLLNQTSNLLSTTTNTLGITESPVYLSSQRPFLSSTTTQNEVMQIVAKSEAAAIAEQTMPADQTSTIAHTVTTTISSMPQSMETVVAAPINTEKLDDLVNSTLESHIGSPPTRTEQTDRLLGGARPDVLISSRDVMLNSRPSMIVSTPILNTTLQSSILSQELTHTSPNLSPEVILNTQISPSLMCRNSDTLMPPATICQTNPTVDTTSLLPVVTQSQSLSPIAVSNPITIVATTEPENAVLLEAAVDLLKTQKELEQTLPTSNIIAATISSSVVPDVTTTNSLSQLHGNNFVQQTQFTTENTTTNTDLLLATTTTQTKDNKTSEFVIPVPVKEMTGVATTAQDKKNEDQMIPQSFTSLTENELINLINPSCFDQGNNTTYH